jgi:hypothetical protein
MVRLSRSGTDVMVSGCDLHLSSWRRGAALWSNKRAILEAVGIKERRNVNGKKARAQASPLLQGRPMSIVLSRWADRRPRRKEAGTGRRR